MRTLPLVVMTVVLGMSVSPAFCQETERVALEGTTRALPAQTPVQDDASAQDDAAADTRSRSGFGQVMALLTGLLEDAAQREASGGRQGFALDNPAVVVSVTPVQGADSFVRRDGSLPRDDDDQRDESQHDAPRRDTANARLAVQPGLAPDGHVPDATPR